MDSAYNIIFLIAGVIIGIFLCSKCNRVSEVIQEIDYITYIDTTYSTHIDTILFYDTNFVTQTSFDTIKYDITKNNTFSFVSSINDDLIEGEIFSKFMLVDKQDLMMTEQYIDYSPKFPKYIHQIDTVKIHQIDSIIVTNTIHNNASKINLLVGTSLTTDFNALTGLYFTGGIDIKNNNFLYGYDPFNNLHQISYIRRIDFNKKLFNNK